jgi:signal transduction histidine kinase
VNTPEPPRLLVVDDQPSQVRALCDTLQDQGYVVVGCSDGSTALHTLRNERFDLLLADLMMPQMNGIELLRAALAIDETLVAIIMTGEGTIGTAVEAMKSGALDYILKPFKLSAVLPVLTRALTMRRLRLRNAALERSVREHAAELEAANRELEAFTRSVSHDLRSPLNAILGFSTLLSEAMERASSQQRTWLRHVQRAAQQMLGLTDALMRLSYAGKQALKLEPVDVGALVRGVVDELQLAHAPRSVRVQVSELPVTTADASLLRQVFVNLLSNAFKYTRGAADALIDVHFERTGAERVFSVRDNGSGFDMAHAERLFHPFARLQGAEAFEGSGVGLSIVQRIVQRHGGRVWAQSAPGQGASFFFTL